MRNGILAAVITLLVAASLGAGYLAGSGNQRVVASTSTYSFSTSLTVTASTTMTVTATTTQLATTTQVATSSAVPQGISLGLGTNATTIHEGQNVAINATLIDVLNGSGINEVLPSYHWPFNGLLMFDKSWPPCGYNSPLELIVLKGNYSTSEIAGMGPGGTPPLGCFENTQYLSFGFEPGSDLVYVTGLWSVNFNVSTRGPVNASIIVTTNGYWDNGTKPTYPTGYGQCVLTGGICFLAAPHSFVKGAYTIAVADEWGQVALTYLTVD